MNRDVKGREDFNSAVSVYRTETETVFYSGLKGININ